MRERLTYANVMATLAVFFSLGAGAFAVGLGRNDVKSRNIADDTIKSRDVGKDALLGQDIRDETLDFKEIREDRLDTSQFAKVVSGASFCDPAGLAFVECASVRVGAEQTSDFLVLASGGQSSAGSPSAGQCQIAVDGTALPTSGISPGEAVSNNADPAAANGFATTTVAPSIPEGSHTVSLQCNETSGDTFIQANISVLVLDAF